MPSRRYPLILGAVIVGVALSSTWVQPRVAVPGAPFVAATPSPAAWQALRRPLHLPVVAPGAACPRATARTVSPAMAPAVGTGPVYGVPIGPHGRLAVVPVGEAALATPGAGAGWYVQKVLWAADPTYRGPVLVRGRRLDGPGVMRLAGPDGVPEPELRLPAGGTVYPSDQRGSPIADGWPGWPSLTFVSAPGCYAYQVDGTTFSETIVVEVIALR